jgi:hypothetical protein
MVTFSTAQVIRLSIFPDPNQRIARGLTGYSGIGLLARTAYDSTPVTPDENFLLIAVLLTPKT